jgi:hypothetical protein
VSLEDFTGSLGQAVERRGFLKRAGVATLGIMGLGALAPESAMALYTTHGCDLCNPPGSCGPNLQCAWCWRSRCSSGHWYYCCEGRQAGGNCNSEACPAYCSYYTGPWGTC